MKLIRKRNIYLSGPMTGLPEFNYPTFYRVAAQLRQSGHRVYNPAEFPYDGDPNDFPIRKAFASYCNFICLEADTMVMLPGWERSKGALAERQLALNCAIDIIEWRGAL
ncbi:DUF4406 domain-containing protein [Brucella gallinifaecis]|uniref:DUF4406 domain-containing protein n=1 Tax=Brucella gallinifaecis TaxID=215590 RepID=A0A502BPF7_9HYPH|nr:DUF4406 domain-containing protein [Brucella gallinifaecis]TPF75176.1 DUF4406 domain-containing protein [Brucella gallinifaecis]